MSECIGREYQQCSKCNNIYTNHGRKLVCSNGHDMENILVVRKAEFLEWLHDRFANFMGDDEVVRMIEEKFLPSPASHNPTKGEIDNKVPDDKLPFSREEFREKLAEHSDEINERIEETRQSFMVDPEILKLPLRFKVCGLVVGNKKGVKILNKVFGAGWKPVGVINSDTPGGNTALHFLMCKEINTPAEPPPPLPGPELPDGEKAVGGIL